MEFLFIAFEMFVYNGISGGIVFKANIYIYIYISKKIYISFCKKEWASIVIGS